MFTSGVKIAAIRWQNHTSTHELTSILTIFPSQLLSHMYVFYNFSLFVMAQPRGPVKS